MSVVIYKELRQKLVVSGMHSRMSHMLRAQNLTVCLLVTRSASITLLCLLLSVEIWKVPHLGYKHHEGFIRKRGKWCVASLCKSNSRLHIFLYFSCFDMALKMIF